MNNPIFRKENQTTEEYTLIVGDFLLYECLIFIPPFVEKTVLSSLNDFLKIILGGTIIYQKIYLF
jgi:hypothetical protein